MPLRPDDEDLLLKSFKRPAPLKTRKTCPNRIKVDGEFVTLQSGKTIWNNIGPAKSAMKNHLQRQRLTPMPGAPRWETRRVGDEAIKEFVEKHVEYVPVDSL